MGADDARARGSLRFSLGHTSTPQDVDAVGARDRAAVGGAGPPAPPPADEPGGPRRADTLRRWAVVRVLAAMSGGVDSAVAAARAVDAGHDVTGVHLALSANPQTVPHRRARLLHARGRPRRPPGRRRDRHPVLRLGPGRAVPRRRGATTSSPSTRPAARRTRACAATRRSSSPRCSTGPWRSASTRSSPATTRASATTAGAVLHRAVDPAKDQSYVLAVLTARPAGAGDVPARATRPRPRSAREAAAARPGGRRQAGLPRHLLHRRRRHPAASCGASSATRPGDDRRRGRRGARPARRRVRLHRRASAAGCGSAARPRTAGRATCWPSRRSPAR